MGRTLYENILMKLLLFTMSIYADSNLKTRAGEMARWMKCLLLYNLRTRVPIRRTHVNAGWACWSTSHSSAGKVEMESSEQAS